MSEEQNNQNSVDVSKEINFDALAAPADNYIPEVHGLSTNDSGSNIDNIPGSQDEQQLIDNLPNIDDSIKDSVKKDPDNYTYNTDDHQKNNNNDSSNTDDNSSGTNEETPYWMKPFETVKANLEAEGGSLDLPDDLNEENWVEHFADLVNQLNGNEESKIHPELAKIQNAIDNGLSYDEAIGTLYKASDWRSMSNRDLMSNEYKKMYPDATQDQLDTVLDKLENSGAMDLEAGRMRKNLETHEKSALETETANRVAANKERNESMSVARTKQVKEAIETLDKMQDVFGLPISKADKDDFKPFFESVVSPDTSGVSPLLRWMQSNENVLKVAMMMYKGDAKVKSEVTKAKESGKQAVLGKLSKSPQLIQKSGNGNMGLQIDLDALAAPERITN